MTFNNKRKSIKRHSLDCEGACSREDRDGDWVTFADHEQIMINILIRVKALADDLTREMAMICIADPDPVTELSQAIDLDRAKARMSAVIEINQIIKEELGT